VTRLADRPLRTPGDLARALRASPAAAVHWRALTPAARRVASRWIDGAQAPDVRAWRIGDVLRRADRYSSGAGPFYPTDEDQRLLARPRKVVR
jgi:Bacteriocin-protection, YdeI or OmpD-Associated